MHLVEDGVIPKEYEAELAWARSRPLSMRHCFPECDRQGAQSISEQMRHVMDHYTVERVSDAKAAYGLQRFQLIFSLHHLLATIICRVCAA